MSTPKTALFKIGTEDGHLLCRGRIGNITTACKDDPCEINAARGQCIQINNKQQISFQVSLDAMRGARCKIEDWRLTLDKYKYNNIFWTYLMYKYIYHTKENISLWLYYLGTDRRCAGSRQGQSLRGDRRQQDLSQPDWRRRQGRLLSQTLRASSSSKRSREEYRSDPGTHQTKIASASGWRRLEQRRYPSTIQDTNE